MIEADRLEQSVAVALELNPREIGHLVALKQLRKAIEDALTKDLADDLTLVPAPSPLGTLTIRQKAFQHFERTAAITEVDILLSSLMRG
jgi:hypothetical protein